MYINNKIIIPPTQNVLERLLDVYNITTKTTMASTNAQTI